ncbi:MAG: acyl-CoA dehydrogenase family protein [bacterium]|nr:acyl-CoA dehydrogenase family protein [bacterium]
MDFCLTEEQIAIRDIARKIANDLIIPNAARYDLERETPWPVIKALGALGMMAPICPEKYGGPGLGYLEYALIGEQISRGCSGVGTVVGAHCSLGTNPIIRYGSEEQKVKYLEGLSNGTYIGAFALTEPDAGSDASNIRVLAEDKGDHWLINGEKQWTTNGDIARTVILFATVDPARGLMGITPFLIDTEWEGFSTGTIEKTMGIHASHQVETRYHDMKVPKDSVLGGMRNVGRGFQIAMDILDGARIGVAASATGIMTRAIEESVKYSQQRVQFGKSISKYQAIQLKIADMSMKANASRLMCYYAAWLKDQGLRVTREAAMAKCFASDAAMWVANEAIQIHGGYGYSMDYPCEKLLRDAKIHQIYEGTNEIMRTVIARDVYKRGLFMEFEEIEKAVTSLQCQ